jgi:hypothetical protein
MAEAREGEPRVRIGPYVYQSTARDPEPREFFPDESWTGQPSDPDSWDIDPDVDLPNDRYHGVRRANGDRPRRRLGLVLAVVGGLVLLAAVVTLVRWTAPAADRTTWADGTSPGPLPSEAEVPAAGPPSASTPATVGSVAANPPVAAPIAFEAEAGPPAVKRRGTDVLKLAGASGGEVVRLVGESSEIELRGVDIPTAGKYQITVYYVGEKAGTASVTVANAAPSTVTFSSGSGCCLTTAVNVAIPAGRQTITLSVTGGGPAIDRIVIAPSPA